MEAINERIKAIRTETGMTRKEFAEAFEIPIRTLEDWEYARRTPPGYVVKLLAYQVRMEMYQLSLKEANKKSASLIYNDRNVNIILDTDGNKIVVIHDIIFKNKQNISWNDVERYLRQYVGEFYTIAEDNEKIYIGTDLPDEYAHSNYTVKLKGGLAKTKVNLVQAIPELVEISTNPIFIENHEKKHRKDAKYGWYRYDAKFAIAIYNRNGEVEKYNVFNARMIIRVDSDGRKYLYDIINIKKGSEYPA